MLKSKGVNSIALFHLTLLTLLLNDFTHANGLGEGTCNSQPCWELYQIANDYYQADVPGIGNQQARKCTVLRTYKSCLVKLDTTACAGTLSYQGTRRALRAEFSTNSCTEDGPIYPEGPQPIKTETVTPCSYNDKPEYSYCTLFGDPHLITFNGEQVTCKLEGAWPLIDNKFLTVQVTNSPLSASTRAATVTQKITVVVKGRGERSVGDFCGSKDAVFYSAEAGSLPTTFTDGMREYGSYNSIQVNTITPGEEVEIYLRYIDATVTIRQIRGRYMSVGIRIPEVVLNGTLGDADGNSIRQLCTDSCPNSERVNITQILGNISRGSPQQKAAYHAAGQSCKEKDVTDFFYDSCVFDLLMTQEKSFTSMANNAYNDVRKYASRQPRWTNRTQLELNTKSSSSRKLQTNNSGIESAAVAPSSSGLVRTLLFVYIMHVISLLVC